MKHSANLRPGVLGRWLREPLLQFLVAGLALFVGYRAANRNRDPSPQPGRIELTEDDLRQISVAWLAQGRQAPTDEQIQKLIEARIREEILYREALNFGLDKDDTIIKRRLAQKMEFLFEDVAALREPTNDELKAWFDRNTDRFARPARATFRHIYFSPDRRGAHTRDDAVGARDQLAGQPADAPAGAVLGDRFMLQDYYGDRSFDDVAKTFGPVFANALFQLTPGTWEGPVESGYGWHLVWIDSITPSRVPAFEDIEPDVKAAWIEDQRVAVRQKAFEAMRARYEVVLPRTVTAGASAPPAEVSR